MYSFTKEIAMFYVKPQEVHPILDKYILADGMKQVFDFAYSEGCYVEDSITKKKYLDCFGQYASSPLGYNHPKVLERLGHMLNAVDCKIVNSDLYSVEYASFVKTLFEKSLPSYFTKAFFIEGGSAAVENCLKVAFDWKSKKLKLLDKDSNKLDIVHLRQAFHGRGGYTLSLTNTGSLKTSCFPKFPWTRVTNPKIYFPMD